MNAGPATTAGSNEVLAPCGGRAAASPPPSRCGRCCCGSSCLGLGCSGGALLGSLYAAPMALPLSNAAAWLLLSSTSREVLSTWCCRRRGWWSACAAAAPAGGEGSGRRARSGTAHWLEEIKSAPSCRYQQLVHAASYWTMASLRRFPHMTSNIFLQARTCSLMKPAASFWSYAPWSSSKEAILGLYRLYCERRPTTVTLPCGSGVG